MLCGAGPAVARDERELGERAVLNLGHTVGHAIEAAAGFGVIPHGEAVGIGMVAEAVIGVEQGWTPPDTPDRIAALLQRLGLPVAVARPGLRPVRWRG